MNAYTTETAQAAAPAAESAAAPPNTGKLAAASSIGTALEWYDFTVYNIMAALIFNHVFFPSFDPLVGTILAFSTYAVGYVSRPIGGIVFGHLGDVLGRRFVLVTTLVIMGVTTALMGLLPGYANWGIWSPLLLVTLRFIQGIALGGEWAGAVLLSMEHGKPHQRGRNASFAQVGPSCGSLIGTGLITLVTLAMSADDFQQWGWRIPFLLSLVLVIFGLWLRRGVGETPAFLQLEASKDVTQSPIREVFTQHMRPLLIAGGSRIGSDVLYALVVVFTLTYVTTVLNLPRPLALGATMLGAIGKRRRSTAVRRVVGSLRPSSGVYRRCIGGDSVGVCVLRPARQQSTGVDLHGCGDWAVDPCGDVWPQAAFITEQFPTRVRYAGSSLAYTLAGIIGGGFAPLIITSLFKSYDSTLAISAYVALALLITLWAVWAARETAHKPL
ncbi:Inner membrane metabolite transport protein yhjE [Serratia marcescens]|uniref:Inner membrane metabolite transport protein yhjE n=1 Tax=Serratia marcescens TaxID=615 RepID=A0A379YPH4_SERMA|nr:Inner membrane metabolite transport protein yhjE [Serratia marcescens]